MPGGKVIGLTGGIASGKSTVSRQLQELGARVIDADALARRVVEPGQPAHAEIVAEFGPSVLDAAGAIDRKALAAVVFADPARRRRLEAITHPRIAEAARREAAGHFARGEPLVIYEAALLVENGAHRMLDGLIVVSAPTETQIERLRSRDGLTEEEARARLAAQLPLASKVAVADWVIDNSGSEEATRAAVARLWEELKSR